MTHEQILYRYDRAQLVALVRDKSCALSTSETGGGPAFRIQFNKTGVYASNRRGAIGCLIICSNGPAVEVEVDVSPGDVHSNRYVDYSHGVRLVRNSIEVHGRPKKITDLLTDPSSCGIVSDEGPMIPPGYPAD